MAIVRCPDTMTSITLVGSGTLVPDADNNITVTADEATRLCYPPAQPRHRSTTVSTGATTILWPNLGDVMTGYTVAGSNQTINSAGVSSPTILGVKQTLLVTQGFKLVSG